MGPALRTTAGPGHAAEGAFREAYEAHFDYVWHALRRLGVRERDLEDLAHDVFVAFFRGLDRFDPARSVRPWLFGIAFRVASDYRRRARFAREVVGADGAEIDRVADRGPQPLERLEQRERQRLVLDALESLDLDQRAVFVMVELHGHSVTEAAEALGANVNTLYSRLRLGRQRFSAAVARLRAQRGES